MLVYVGNTTLYLAPPNPVTAQLLPVIRAIQNPLFAQNWHLFAPDPVKSDFVLTVRCRTKDEVSAWQEITAPLLARHHKAPKSPLGRGLRGVSRVQLALLIHTPPPFSRRAQPPEAGSTRYVILPWLPYQQVGG